VDIPQAADANNAMFHGWITTSGDAVISTGVQTANTDYLARVQGTIRPSANGTLQLRYASEVSTTVGAVIRQQSFGVLKTIS
jgi:hypothetical protein